MKKSTLLIGAAVALGGLLWYRRKTAPVRVAEDTGGKVGGALGNFGSALGGWFTPKTGGSNAVAPGGQPGAVIQANATSTLLKATPSAQWSGVSLAQTFVDSGALADLPSVLKAGFSRPAYGGADYPLR